MSIYNQYFGDADPIVFIVKHYLKQGCGNTMPDLSDLVQFHTGQVRNFYLLVLGQVQVKCIKKVNTILYFIV